MKPLRYFFIMGKIISAILLIASLQNCVTIIAGKSNTLVFENPDSLNAEIYLDGEILASGTIKVPKEKIQHGSILEIKTEGHEKEYLILRKPHPAYVVANFAIGGIPLIVDMATGNLLRPSPRKFTIKQELSN